MSSDQLENLLSEDRTFAPSPEFVQQANIKVDEYDRADADRLAFWEEQAEYLKWDKRWHTVLDWQVPFAKIGRAHV